MSPKRGPVRLAIVSDFDLVVAGVERMLAPHSDRVVVVRLSAQASSTTDVDVVLWDPSARPVGDALELGRLAGRGATLVAFDWTAELAALNLGSPRLLPVTCRRASPAWNWSKPWRQLATTGP